MNKQTIKVEIKVYVGADKYEMDSHHIWDPETDELDADQMAQMILEHVHFKMNSALNPCYFVHSIEHENMEETK